MGQVLSLNDRAKLVADRLVDRAAEYGIGGTLVGGARVVDAGVKSPGSVAAGLEVARICLADLGQVTLGTTRVAGVGMPAVLVNVNHPLPACMASQYAGWQIVGEGEGEGEDGKGGYFAMGSGPMRAAYGKEELFDKIGFRERVRVAVGVLEGKMPDINVAHDISLKCQVDPSALTLICARTASLVGGVQVVARSVETAMHKLHELKFDLTRVVGGFGSAPLPPVAANDMAAIGRTNDAVLYGGEVTLYVIGDDDSLAEAAKQLPSKSSRDYGKPFAETFADYDNDFYRIDPMLFSPAAVCLQNLETGRTHARGEVNDDVLKKSFFG